MKEYIYYKQCCNARSAVEPTGHRSPNDDATYDAQLGASISIYRMMHLALRLMIHNAVCVNMGTLAHC